MGRGSTCFGKSRKSLFEELGPHQDASAASATAITRPSCSLAARGPIGYLASVDHDQPLSGRLYRRVEADLVTHYTVSCWH
jgi:hypothetical protein